MVYLLTFILTLSWLKMLYPFNRSATLSELTLTCIQEQLMAEAQFALSILTLADDLRTISATLLQYANPVLWLAFLQNTHIQDAIKPHLSDMLAYAQVVADTVPFNPLWDEIIVELQTMVQPIIDNDVVKPVNQASSTSNEIVPIPFFPQQHIQTQLPFTPGYAAATSLTTGQTADTSTYNHRRLQRRPSFYGVK